MNRSLRDGNVLRGIGLVCAGVLCFVITDSVNKALARELPPLEVSWGRAVSFAIVMAVVLFPRLGLRLVRTRKPGLQLLRGLVFGASSTMAVFALETLPLADATAIVNLQPLVILALSAPLLGERVGWRQWLAVFVGFAGVLMIVQPDGDGQVGGALWMLGGSVGGAIYLLLNRRLGLDEKPTTSLFLGTVVAAVALSLVVPAVWVTPTRLEHWLGFVAAGLSGGAGHYLFIRAYTMAKPSTLAPFNYSHLLWGIAASWAIFGEVPTALTLAGMAVIGGAGIYVTLFASGKAA